MWYVVDNYEGENLGFFSTQEKAEQAIAKTVEKYPEFSIEDFEVKYSKIDNDILDLD